MSRRILTLACAGALLALTGCPGKECSTTADCTGGKQCVADKCVEPTTACSPACSGATPVCDETAKKCRVCTAKAGCTGGKTCDTSATNGKCVECLTSANCGLELPVCDPSTKACVTCIDGEGCAGSEVCDVEVPGGECVASGCQADTDCAATPATPVCDTAAHKCVVCTAAKGCTAPATCDLSVTGGQCTGCTASSQCTGGTNNVCNTATGKCVVCTATEGCTSPQVCDVTVQGGQCKAPGCNTSADCATATPTTPVCDVANHKCVVCIAGEGCATGKKCDVTVQGGACVDATCTTDGECTGTPATPVCDTGAGKCVVCTATKGCTAPATCDLTVTGGVCKGCTASSQCTTGTANVCDTTSGKCVVCTSTEGCDATHHCDLAVTGGACVSNGCTDNGGCTGTPSTPTCDTATGKCVVCTATAGCASPLKCDLAVTNGKCVDCLQSTDCTGAKKVCSASKCVNCTASEGCSGATPVCDTTATDGQCVACTADATCAASGKVCDTGTKTCVTCTSTKGCSGTTPVCDTTVTGGACVGCTSSGQCSDGTPVCNTTTKTCVKCTASEGCSGTTPVCDGGTACVGCLSSTTCAASTPAKPVCDTTAKTCVTCLPSGEGCTAPQTCVGGQCVGCTSSAQCSGGTPVCNTTTSTCVVCTAAEGCTLPQTCDTTVTGGRCTGCTADANCSGTPTTPACNTTTGTCVVCTATYGCSGSLPKCKTTVPACVECLADGDCSAKPSTPKCGPSNTCIASGTDVSAQIATARGTAAGTGLTLPIDGAYVTYLKPATGTETAGFFVQGAQTGPALFVQVDPAATTPALAAGDKVSFTITEMSAQGTLVYAAALTGLTRQSQGNDLSGLIQDRGYVKIAGTLGTSAYGGNSYTKFPLTTAGITASPFPSFRIPTALKDSLGLDAGCAIDLKTGVMWRYNTDAQPSCFVAGDLVVTSCPAPKVTGASALSNTSVSVTFSRPLLVSSVLGNGSQFTIAGGLTVSAAAASGSVVTLTTNGQTAGNSYTVTVATTVQDVRGTALDSTANTATFTGLSAGCAPAVVISQVYGGGGNSGATFQNDFVELHNRSKAAVDVTAWSIQYTSATGATWSNNSQALCPTATCTSLSIPAGGYFLIQLASGGAVGSLLPTADLVGTINMSGSNGKVALSASTAALSGNCPTGVMDIVGFGTADCPTSKMGALSNTTAGIRNGGAVSPGTGCDNTGNNAADFTIATPVPRNSATTALNCGCD